MEFLLVPLTAIAAVTFVIGKLAELAFHIHLSWRLLLLLAGFSWLVSMVLPGLFFQSAGLMGSVVFSLLCAAGFAWLAAAYDLRTGASRPIPVGKDATAVPEPETAETEPVVNELQPGPFVPAPQERMNAAVPVLETIPGTEPKMGSGVTDEIKGSAERAEDENQAIAAAEGHETDRGVSGSLADLLEVAFEQRNLRQDVQALETFRLIKRRFRDGDALPMVVAEIVSILQSQGNIAEAAEELTEILQVSEIRNQDRLVAVFEQKLADLRAESGKKAD